MGCCLEAALRLDFSLLLPWLCHLDSLGLLTCDGRLAAQDEKEGLLQREKRVLDAETLAAGKLREAQAKARHLLEEAESETHRREAQAKKEREDLAARAAKAQQLEKQSQEKVVLAYPHVATPTDQSQKTSWCYCCCSLKPARPREPMRPTACRAAEGAEAAAGA